MDERLIEFVSFLVTSHDMFVLGVYAQVDCIVATHGVMGYSIDMRRHFSLISDPCRVAVAAFYA